MEAGMIIDVFRSALQVVILIVASIVLPGLAVGLVVSVFQAATQINEQTLSFLPRLLITLAAIGLGGHWFTMMLMDFTIMMFNTIPEVVG